MTCRQEFKFPGAILQQHLVTIPRLCLVGNAAVRRTILYEVAHLAEQVNPRENPI
jgi:hypothetical protein